MIKEYFPACPINGPIRPPAPFAHLLSRGSVPAKCITCDKLFEGVCLRQPSRYMHLDHGPCPFPGDTTPALYTFVLEEKSLSLPVPGKCLTCEHLKNHRYLILHTVHTSRKSGGISIGAWTGANGNRKKAPDKQ